MLTARATALPNTGATGPTLVARQNPAFSEGARPRGATTPSSARSGRHTPTALHEHRTEVSLPPNELGHPQAQIRVSTEHDLDVVRREGCNSSLLILKSRNQQPIPYEKTHTLTLMQILRTKRLFASCPVGRVTSRLPLLRTTTAHEKPEGPTAVPTRAIVCVCVCVRTCVRVCVCACEIYQVNNTVQNRKRGYSAGTRTGGRGG